MADSMGGRLLTEQELRDFRAAWPKGEAVCECYYDMLKDDGKVTYCPLHYAAPDLLAALKAVMNGQLGGKPDFQAERFENARAAIRKAEGM